MVVLLLFGTEFKCFCTLILNLSSIGIFKISERFTNLKKICCHSLPEHLFPAPRSICKEKIWTVQRFELTTLGLKVRRIPQDVGKDMKDQLFTQSVSALFTELTDKLFR